MEMEKESDPSLCYPFDRGDIYSISLVWIEFWNMLNQRWSPWRPFDVKANDTIISMVEQLRCGVEIFAEAISDLKESW